MFYAGVDNFNQTLNVPFDENNFQESSSPVGLLEVDWTNLAGETLPDSTRLFDVCFEPIGGAGDCIPIELSDEPAPIVNLLNNADGDVTASAGEICVRDTIIIDPIVRPVSCPDIEDGEIEVFVSGGRGPYIFNWDLSPAPPQFGPRATNLGTGMKIVTIFDNSRPEPLVRQDTFFVGVGLDVPVANAGEDIMLTCGEGAQLARLEGTGSSGPEFRFRWAPLEEGGTISGPDTIQRITVLSPGEYLYEVTNRETGCFARDTVEVIANLPIANAGSNFGWTCNSDGGTVRLNGTGSSQGGEFSYLWSALNGGAIVDGTETEVNVQITSPGTYVLQVTNDDEGCTATDTTFVADLRADVVADAGPDLIVGCPGDTVLLKPGAEPGTFTYRWLDANGQLLNLGTTHITADTGRYILEVEDENTGCRTRDTTQVTREIRELAIEAVAVTEITCIKDTATVRVLIPEESRPVSVSWEPVGDGVIVKNPDLEEAVVGAPGLYRVVVTNPENQCTNFDEVEVLATVTEPLAEAGESTTLNCEQSMMVLDGAGTSTGPNFIYRWFRGDTSEVSNSLQFEVSTPGTYFLEVTDSTNGCFAKDSVTINVEDDIPTIDIQPVTEMINCMNSQITLTASQPTISNFDILWVPLDSGNITSAADQLSITVDQPGSYRVRIQDTDNLCQGTNEITILGDLIPPFVDAGDSQFITCEEAETVVRGEAFGQNDPEAGISYVWQSVGNGGLVGPTTLDSATVNIPGLFTLTATDMSNGCIGIDTVLVEADTTLPIVIFEGLEGNLGCGDTLVAINATASIRSGPITIEWAGLDDNDDGWFRTENPLIVEAAKPGRYELLITNDNSGCQSNGLVTVEEDMPDLELIFANDSPTEGCPDPGVLLDASPSLIGANFQARWLPLDPGNTVEADSLNPLLARANGIGDYELFVTLGGTCEARDTVSVLPSMGFPEAIAVVNEIEIECGETANLDGTGSSTGDVFSYQWVEATTRMPVANGDAIVSSTNQQGLYTFIVTNINSNCVDSTQVSVMLNTEGLPVANAGFDEEICENETLLSADDPGDQATGIWTTTSGAVIGFPSLNSSDASGLVPGANVFVWTLSAEGCGDYDSDEVTIVVSEAPTLRDDNFTIGAGAGSMDINLLENDDLGTVSDYSLTILSDPTLGNLSDLDADKGTAIYSVSNGNLAATDNFSYIVCNTACENLCDTAIVSLTIEPVVIDPNQIDRPNGITPNGDGLNDEFAFEVIEQFPGNFPDNHMMIFNRWGDLVYEAKPYMNDWTGTNNMGQDLPAATYYYILRLNLADGLILRGDITIVR